LEIKNEAKGNSQVFEMTFKFLVFSLQNHNNSVLTYLLSHLLTCKQVE
jgi:hypothetical protein